MRWVAPTEKDAATDTLEKRLWEAADQLRANSGLTSEQYSTPVLGLTSLRHAKVRFTWRIRHLESRASGLITIVHFLPARFAERPGRGYCF